MRNRLNSKKGMFNPGQIVNYEHYSELSNDPEKVKLLLLNKAREERHYTNDTPVVWRAYYLSGSTGKYINSLYSGHSKKDKNLVLIFEYALEL